MKNIYNGIKKHKKYLIIGIPVLLIVLYFVFGRGNGKTESYLVNRANIEQSVVFSGKIESSDKADLGFAAGGRIGRIFIKNNQNVAQGQILAQLEIGDLLADLKIKQANLLQENTEIESAYRTLLTEDLELIPDSSDYDVEPPTISGIYNGSEGRYKVIIDIKEFTVSDFSLLTFGLEKTEITINKEGSTPFGTKGLFISFPDADLLKYQDTIWYLDIPNKSGDSYLSNLNAYNEALAAENAQADSVAQAEIQKIQAEIKKNTIYAPFYGRVTNIEKEVGENASIGERVVSILGEKKLEVMLQVSELDVSRLVPGVVIQISLDAFPEEKFDGILQTVNSKDTEIDGVPVYEAFVDLPPDPRIRAGMSATGLVLLDERTDVLAVPLYFVNSFQSDPYVEVLLANKKTEKRMIETGLVGSDNMVEVLSGLALGETIVAPSGK